MYPLEQSLTIPSHIVAFGGYTIGVGACVDIVGCAEGDWEGAEVGSIVGSMVGLSVVGSDDGVIVGDLVAFEGEALGLMVGLLVHKAAFGGLLQMSFGLEQLVPFIMQLKP